MAKNQTAQDANAIRKIIRAMGEDANGRVSEQHAEHGSYIHIKVSGLDMEKLDGEIGAAELPGLGVDYSLKWKA